MDTPTRQAVAVGIPLRPVVAVGIPHRQAVAAGIPLRPVVAAGIPLRPAAGVDIPLRPAAVAIAHPLLPAVGEAAAVRTAGVNRRPKKRHSRVVLSEEVSSQETEVRRQKKRLQVSGDR